MDASRREADWPSRGLIGLDIDQLSAKEKSAGEVGVAEIGLGQVRVAKIGITEVRSAQGSVREVSFSQRGAFEVGLLKVRFCEVRPV